jgi:hypothetical protein
MNPDRAACHEAGHIVVGIHYGINFGDLKSNMQVPTLVDVQLQKQGVKAAHFLVAGMASEELHYSKYDEAGARSDIELLMRITRLSPQQLILRQRRSLKHIRIG